MSRLDSFSGKMMDLVGQVGDNLRTTIPDGASNWIKTGAALGVARTGTRAVGALARRNPAALVAAAVAGGVAWYLVHRHRKQQLEQGVYEGKARRVETRRAAPKTATTRRAPRKSAPASTSGDE